MYPPVRRRYPYEVKEKVLARYLSGESQHRLSEMTGIAASTISGWVIKARRHDPAFSATEGDVAPSSPQVGPPESPTILARRIAQLEKQLEQVTLERDFLKRASQFLESKKHRPRLK